MKKTCQIEKEDRKLDRKRHDFRQQKDRKLDRNKTESQINKKTGSQNEKKTGSQIFKKDIKIE